MFMFELLKALSLKALKSFRNFTRFNISSLAAAVGRKWIVLRTWRHNIYLGQFPVKVCMPLVFGPFSLKPRR
jgi:hypothetical protein